MSQYKIYAMSFAKLYPCYSDKLAKKNRTSDELKQIICWLTGYDTKGLHKKLDESVSVEEFFSSAPKMNPNRKKITGTICGVRIEEIKEPLMQEIRYLDKLVDELARGKPLSVVLRD